MDAQDSATHPARPSRTRSCPPLTSTTIRDPDVLRATLQCRSLSTPLGSYRLQESWAKLTVKAPRALTTPGNGLHEAIVDLVLWRARQHAQGQHVWILPIDRGQALTLDTDTNVRPRGTIAYDEPQRRTTTQRTRTTRNNGNRPPHQPATPPSAPLAFAPQTTTSLPHLQTATTPLTEVWVTVLECGHYYVVAATATPPGPQWLFKGTDTMLAPGAAPPGAVGDLTTRHRFLRGVLQPGDKPPARALAQITSGRAGYHLGLAMLCLAQ